MAERTISVVLNLDTSNWSGNLTNASGQLVSLTGNVKVAGSAISMLETSVNSLGRGIDGTRAKMRDWLVIIGSVRSAMLTVKDVMVGWLGGILNQASQIERLTVMMEGLSSATDDLGKKKEATATLSQLYDMSRKTGISMSALSDGFVKLKSGGLDPMAGSLTALTEATAAFGGNSETFKRASLAIQQMSGKGVVSMEELRRQLGEAVPTAIRAMARGLGETIPELTKQVTQGMVQAKPAIAAMSRELYREYAGSAAQLANTFSGQVSIFKTDMQQLAAAFVGLGEKDSFFQFVVDKIKQLNAELESRDAKNFVAELGNDLRTLATTISSLISFAARFGAEFKIVGETIAVAFAVSTVNSFVKTAQDGLASLQKSAGSVVASFEKVQSTLANASRGPVDTSTLGSANDARVLEDMVALRRNEQAAISDEVRALQTEYVQRNVVVGSMEREVGTIERLIEADTQLRGSNGRYMTVAESRLQLMDELVVTENRLAAAQRLRATTEANLTMAETRLFTAELATTTAETAATVVKTEATLAQGLWTAATTAGTVAVTAFRTAVEIALGPIGLIVAAIGLAAYQFGLFETAADKATAAAKRMKDGFAQAGDAAAVAAQKAKVSTELSNLRSGKRADGSADGQIVTTEGQVVDGPKMSDTDRNTQIAERERQLTDLVRAENANRVNIAESGANEIVQRVTASQDLIVANARESFQAEVKAAGDSKDKIKAAQDKFDSTQAASHDRVIAQLQKERSAAQQGTPTYNGLTLAIDRLNQSYAATGQTTVTLDDALGGAGKNGQKFANAIANGAGEVAQLQAKLNGSFGALAKFDAEVASGAGKYKSMSADQISQLRGQAIAIDALHAAMGGQKAEDAFMSKIQQMSGRIAELNAQLKQTGDSNLAKFNAELGAGAFKGVPQSAIQTYKELATELDNLEGKAKTAQTFKSLDAELAKSGQDAKATWDSFNKGTVEADSRLAQITARFAGVTAGLKGADLDKANAEIAQIVANLQKADMASTMQGWKDETQTILNGLLTEDQARQANYEKEVARQRQYVELFKEGTDERKQAEATFAAWQNAKSQEVSRQNESATVKMARDWLNLGQNMQTEMSSAISSVVDGMASGQLDIGKMAVEIIEQIFKIILEAMIAYAILSAIGLTPQNADGSKMSMGSFLKTGMTSGFSTSGAAGISAGSGDTGGMNVGDLVGYTAPAHHTGGVIGAPTPLTRTVDPAIFASAKKYHDGGYIGGRKLASDEVPIVGKKKELVLTEDQQNMLAGQMSSDSTPHVAVNVINNSGTQVDATSGTPRMQGKQMILDVVLDAASKSASFRNSLKTVVK